MGGGEVEGDRSGTRGRARGIVLTGLSTPGVPLLAFILLLVLHIVPMPAGSELWRAFLDACHAPAFGLFAWVVLRGLRAWPALNGVPHRRLYLFALGGTVAASALAELVQAFGPRDASGWDILRSGLGAAAVLLAVAVVGAEPRARAVPAAWRAAGVVLAGVLLLLPAIPALRLVAAEWQRRAAFPRICDFESAWEERFEGTEGAELQIVAPASKWARTLHGRVARVTFLPGTYPGFFIRGPFPDWGRYDRLTFTVCSDMEAPLQLLLRIHDVRHDNRFADRFNRTLLIEPGVNRVSIPLADVRSAPQGRRMDMAHIAALVLFAVSPAQPFSLLLDSFQLERDRDASRISGTVDARPPERHAAAASGRALDRGTAW